jgi:large subunit ribosomal protein L9
VVKSVFGESPLADSAHIDINRSLSLDKNMKVILQKNVDKLGKIGDVVEAAPGYYRNYLQPRGFAVVASTGALKKREEDLEQLRKKAEATHQEAVAFGETIAALGSVRIDAKAGEGGRLYGKVTNKEIAQALTEKLGKEIDKRTIKTADDITAIGAYKVQVKVAPEVQVEVTVEVYPPGFVVTEKAAKKEETAEVAAESVEAEADDEEDTEE